MSPQQETATAFLKMVVAGNIREAYRKYTSKNFRHHNPYFKEDATSLEKGMEENHAQFPIKSIDIKHVFEADDLVATHSHVILQPGTPGIAAVHILRFEDGKIAEMWDVAQPVPDDSPNENGMF
jgi:predicted SnoaL-like aldol condensation-catalyzing enzyme